MTSLNETENSYVSKRREDNEIIFNRPEEDFINAEQEYYTEREETPQYAKPVYRGSSARRSRVHEYEIDEMDSYGHEKIDS